MDQTGDIIPSILKRLWKPVNANKQQIDCLATVSRIFSSLCECVIGWLGAQQVEEVVPFVVLLVNLEAWAGTVSTHCCFRRAYCQQGSTKNFNGCLVSTQLLLGHMEVIKQDKWFDS